MESWFKISDVIATVAIIVAVIAAIVSFLSYNKTNYNWETSNDINVILKIREYYLEYVNDCLENIELDVFEISNKDFYNDFCLKKQTIIHYKVFLLIERQFVYDKRMKHNNSSMFLWSDWIHRRARDQIFFNSWTFLCRLFVDDQEFVNFINNCMIEARKNV